MTLLAAFGYDCIRSAASKGVWDFVAISADCVQLVQVRTGRWPSPKERKVLEGYAAPKDVVKVMHRWNPRARRPIVRIWSKGEWFEVGA